MKRLPIAVLALFAPLLHAAPTAKIAIGEWEPFIGASLAGNGIVTVIVTEAFARAGWDVEFGFFPWKRSWAVMAEGEYDCTAVWGKTAEREKDALFSSVVYTGDNVLFYRKANPITWDGTVGSLRGKVLGCAAGSAKATVLGEAEREGIVSYDIGGDKLAAMRKLLLGRFDALDENREMGLYLLAARFSESERNSIAVTAALERWPYHVAFTKANPRGREALAAFERGFAELEKTGRLARLWADFYGGKFGPAAKTATSSR